MTATTRDKGIDNEQIAAAYLQKQGYAVLVMNWRCKLGELDIVARKDRLFVIVEVRSRRTIDAAFESINERKRAKLIRAAQMWLSANTVGEVAWRIDVIAVGTQGGKPTIEHREDALDW